MGMFNNLVDKVVKKSPTLLIGLAAGGVIATAVMAAKAQPKVDKAVLKKKEEIFKENPDLLKKVDVAEYKLSFTDYIKVSWRLYLPTAVTAGATIACMVGSNTINGKRTAALATLYSVAEYGAGQFQEKAIEMVGKNKVNKIKHEVAKKYVEDSPYEDAVKAKQVVFTNKGDMVFYDTLSGRYFKSDIEKIRQTINNINQELRTEVTTTLNDVYFAFGLETVELGQNVGWDIDNGLLEIEFTSVLANDNEHVTVMTYYNLTTLNKI